MPNAVYMPILRGLQGENWALRDQGKCEQIYPVVQIPRRKWDLELDKPKAPLAKHIDNLLGRCGLRAALQATQGCAIDGVLLESHEPGDSAEALERISEHSHAKLGVPIVPATGFDRPPDYDATVRACHLRHGAGVLIRATREDVYAYQELKSKLDSLLGELNVAPHQVDLCCDLGAVQEQNEEEDLEMLLGALPATPYLDRWRSFWVAGGAFPENLREVDRESTAYLPRVEWTIWDELRRRLSIPRMPLFSDYGVYHPIAPVATTITNMSTNIRYTTENHWMIIKGRSVKSAGYEDYFERCSMLVSSSEYSGRTFSTGDRYFDDCASGDDGPGNASKWRSADTSHHITYVADQVLKLQSPR